MKKEKSTSEIASAALGTLFLCCVRVVNQNTRALLLLVFCYSYARAAQCIDKEILISKNGNIDIDIEIDKRFFLQLISILILIRAYLDN